MTQRILVALDPDADTPVAVDTAIEIAKRYDAEITCVALVDRDEIEADTSGGGIGSMYFAEKLRATRTDEVREKANRLVEMFVRRIDEAGVRHTGDHVGEGERARTLIDDMRTHDLLVAGRESHFYYAEPERRTHTMARVIEAAAAATLLVDLHPREVRRVAVAYDGSTPAARALQKFAHLRPFGTDVAVRLVHVHGGSESDRRASERLLADARDYLVAYGFSTVEAAAMSGGKAADEIAALADGSGADLVVSGAYAKSGLRRMVFGSAVTTLLERAKVPLFLYR